MTQSKQTSTTEPKKTLSLNKSSDRVTVSQKPNSKNRRSQKASAQPSMTDKSESSKTGSNQSKASNSQAKRPNTKNPNFKKSDSRNKPSSNTPSSNKPGSNKPSRNKAGGHKPHGKHGGKRSAPKLKGKDGLHVRNQHKGRYDFAALAQALPELSEHIIKNPMGESSIDFSNPVAVKMLNKSLLAHHYGVKHWDIPEGYLCPPIPGRADYIHRVADLINDELGGAEFNHKTVTALDIGMGANCIYPIIGVSEYGWRFVASDVDPLSIKMASFIASTNPHLKGRIQCRLQNDSDSIFKGVIKKKERYDITVCNPPFHKSQEEAQQGSQRKIDNLNANKVKRGGRAIQGKPFKETANLKASSSKAPILNFGGQNNELWCPGGEAEFIAKMVKESANYAHQVLWFTTLMSKGEHVDQTRVLLEKVGARSVKFVEMSQGQKVSRFVAWTFLDKQQRQDWLLGEEQE